MKSRHAAALALVVWYLMQPPVVGQGSGRNVWNHAPLRKWERAATFDSEEVCNQRLRASRTVKGHHLSRQRPMASQFRDAGKRRDYKNT
jgi:hypothetical protein